MTDMEIKSISARLDMICQKLDERVGAIGVGTSDEWCGCEIFGKIDILEKMISATWMLEMQMEQSERDWKDKFDRCLKIIDSLGNERKEYSEKWTQAKNTIEKLEASLLECQKKLALQEYQAYNEPKTKRKNQNARRKDINATEVYQMIKGGMSITKVAEKFHASRQTIRKYYIAGENEVLGNEADSLEWLGSDHECDI